MLELGQGSSATDEWPTHDVSLDLRLKVPEVPRRHVERIRLLSRLDEGSKRELTLISAPAGSGKTALLAAWVAKHADQQIAWLSSHAAPEPREVFWQLVAETLHRSGLELPSAMTHGPRLPTHDLLNQLALAVAALPRPVTLVLDGLKVTDNRLAQDIDFLLTHSRRGLRLVIAARGDPMLPLHRYRLKETLAELGTMDLALSAEETEELLGAFGVELSPESLISLHDRTQGWVVGVRFAAMLLAKSKDPEKTVEHLAGDHGDIAEYLIVECLQTLPVKTLDLLLWTSIVDPVPPGLMTELGGHLAEQTLARLARGNLMVEQLEGRPGWFRYHPFLRDLLRAELGRNTPGRLNPSRRRAAKWCAQHDQVQEAVELAAASGAWHDAADYVIEGFAVPELLDPPPTSALASTLSRMPAATSGAAISAVRAAMALGEGLLDVCAMELLKARAAAVTAGSSAPAAIGLTIDIVEAVRARAAGEPRAVDLTVDAASRIGRQPVERSAAHAALSMLVQSNLAMSLFMCGRFSAASRTLASALSCAEARGLHRWSMKHEAQLALLESVQGRLSQAEARARRAISIAEGTDPSAGVRWPVEADIAMAWVCLEQSNTAAADGHLARASGNEIVDPVAKAVTMLLQARLLRAQGDVVGALELIGAARSAPPSRAEWVKDLVAVEAAEGHLARRETDEALRVLSELHHPDRETAVAVLGRAQLMRRDWQAMAQTVARLSKDERGSASAPAVVRGLLLEAALELHRGHDQRARAALSKSLRIAGPDCARRPFQEAPTAVRRLLNRDAHVLHQAAWLGPSIATGAPPQLAASDVPALSAAGGLLEPLTTKEREVLWHLSELLSTQEIAAAMFISVNTVRTHVRSILRKLAVSRRNEAVRRARALGLLDTTDLRLVRSG